MQGSELAGEPLELQAVTDHQSPPQMSEARATSLHSIRLYDFILKCSRAPKAGGHIKAGRSDVNFGGI